MEGLDGVRSEIQNCVVEEMGVSELTAVQRRCVPALLLHRDVIVQSPTGSGKTLAYLLPLFELLLRQRTCWQAHQVGALVIVPSRELALQVFEIACTLAAATGLRAVSLSAGTTAAADVARFNRDGGNVVVGTPRRLEELFDRSDFQLRQAVKSMEVLVVDEADRLCDRSFVRSLATVLGGLPKQRRVGLFSATQASEMEELLKFGVRNAERVVVAGGSLVTPSTLDNFYAVLPAERKLAAVLRFVRERAAAKTLVFASTCACVDYLARVVRQALKGRAVVALHGKKRARRLAAFERFRRTAGCVLFCTDLMARGIDVRDVDWVVQLDVPKKSSWFVHRSGRAARFGRRGSALLLLSPEESAYAQFLESNESVKMEEMTLKCSAKEAEELRLRMVAMATKDRDFLEKGTKAFVSYIQAYSKHDCQIVCNIKDMDIIGAAHCFGLLRLPKMPELRGVDLSTFRRTDVQVSSIAYKDKSREALRQERISDRGEQAAAAAKAAAEASRAALKKRQRKRAAFGKDDWDDLARDNRLIKQLKKGKISAEEFDDKFLQDE